MSEVVARDLENIDRKILPTIPASWSWASIGESVQIIDYRGRTPPYSETGIPHLRSSNIKNGSINWQKLAYLSEADYDGYMTRGIPTVGDVLFTTEAPLGEVALAPETKFSLAQRLLILRSPKSLFLPKFLAFQLMAPFFQALLRLRGTGTTVTGISSRNFKSLCLCIAPLDEQDRVVAKIEELLSDLDAGVSALERAKANLKRYRAALLQAAVQGALTEQWRSENAHREPASKLLERILTARRQRWEAGQLAKYAAAGKQPPKNWRDKYVEPSPPDSSGLPKLPEAWCWASVDQICEVGTGTTPTRTNSAFYQGGSIPWVLSTAVNKPFVDEAEEFVTDAALQGTTLRLYPPGTLLIALYGEGKTRGMVSELLIEATINQALGALVFYGTASDVRPYVKQFLASAYAALRRQAAGGMQPNLNLGIVKQIAVPFPPLAEQRVIIQVVAERLSLIEAADTTIEHGLLRAARLRQSILKQAFEGNLVPQDPTDEPASTLLARIRNQRSPSKVVSNKGASNGNLRKPRCS
jgi:type I restriction enzyme S subunit